MVKPKSQFEEYKFAIMMIGGAVLIVILLVFLLAVPVWKDLSKNSKELNAKKEELSALETKLENLKQLSTKETELKQKNAKVLAALPKDKDISRLFVEFENVAKQSGLLVSKVTEGGFVSTPGATQSATELIAPVTYQVTGTANNYASLKSALQGFEKALRIVSISGLEATNENSALKVNFDVTTYKRSEE